MGQLGKGSVREQQAAEERLRDIHGIPHRHVAVDRLRKKKIMDPAVIADIDTAYGRDPRVSKALGNSPINN